MTISVMDIFCGAGGSSAGARMMGAEVICGIDAWHLAANTFSDNFSTAKVDVSRLHSDSQPPRLFKRGDIDLLLASPECTNHSVAKGSQPRCEESRRTSHYVVNFAKRLRPRWIALENVTQLQKWSGFTSIIDELRHLDYKINLQELDAVDFGVPQTRKRLFVLCDRERTPNEVKARTRKPRPLERILQLNSSWPSTPLYDPKRAEATLVRAESAMSHLGKGVPFIIVYYSRGNRNWLSMDQPLRTVTTHDRFGLVTWKDRVPMLRMLQVEELRLAMGIPKDFVFKHGNRQDKVKMIGNGVCPPVMQAVIETLAM